MKPSERSFSYFLKTYGLNSIFLKNLVKILVVFLVPILIIVFLCYNYFTASLKKSIDSESVKNMCTVTAVIDNIILETKQNTVQLSLNNTVKLFMQDADYNPQLSYDEDIQRTINSITNIYSYISSVYVFSETNDNIITNTEVLSTENFRDKDWLDYYNRATTDDLIFIQRKKNDNYPYFFTVIRPVFSGSKKNGAVIVNLNIDKLCDIIQKNNSIDTLTILHDGKVAFADNSTFIGQRTSTLYDPADVFTQSESGAATITIDGEKMHTVFCNSSSDNITYLSFIPDAVYQSSIKSEFTSLKLMLFIIILLCIGIALLMSTISFDAVKKIILLIDYPEKRAQQKMRKNEISYIMNNIISGTKSDAELELKLAEQLKKLKRATTTALQSQINSHFLCNTLDLINWQCYKLMSEKNDISKMLALLGKLVKNGTNISTNLTTVQEEVDHTKTYISLCKIHYTDKFDAHWNIDKDITECDIIRLTLQPIIENSLEHGIRKLDRKGNIYIDITSDEHNLYISVADDGTGMSDSAIEQLNQSISSEVQTKQKHIGLANINSRINLLFGDNYGVKVSKSEYGGLCVSITIPKSDCDII